MERLNKHFCYWIEDSNEMRRLSFGCYYPDDVDGDDIELMRQKQVEYLAENIDLSNYKKLLICERLVFDEDKKPGVNHIWQIDGSGKPQQILFENNHKQEKWTSYYCISELISDDPNIIASEGDFVFIIPKEYDINTLPEPIFHKFKSANYDSFKRENYIDLYLDLVNMVEDSSLIVWSGMVDGRSFNKTPPFVGTMYSIDIYGELCKFPVLEKYLAP